jgi:predicted RNase H-like HicB family nuclease
MGQGASQRIITCVGTAPPVGNGRHTGARGTRRCGTIYAIAEAGDDGSWWISFPGRDGIISAADDAKQIVAQAQDALESAAMHDGQLPPRSRMARCRRPT